MTRGRYRYTPAHDTAEPPCLIAAPFPGLLSHLLLILLVTARALTTQALEMAGIKHSGTGNDNADALRPALIKALGRKLAYFSVSAAVCGLRGARAGERCERRSH